MWIAQLGEISEGFTVDEITGGRDPIWTAHSDKRWGMKSAQLAGHIGMRRVRDSLAQLTLEGEFPAR